MATRRYQVRMQGTSGLPEDVYENVLYFDTNSFDTVEGTCDGIHAAYDAFPRWAGSDGMEIRVYEPEGGQPVFRKEYTFAKGGALQAPAELAICLSYATVDDPDQSTARRRGRIYLGPLATTATDSPRPATAVINDVLNLGEALAQVGFAANTTWHMYSVRDLVSAKIESIWCDDAWDTQRRRGAAPTMRTVRDVQ
jgi:hypothetical protein